MNKLFLQSLKAEQSIQALRCELEDAERECRDMRGELSEADWQLWGLHVQLSNAEQAQHETGVRLGQTREDNEKVRVVIQKTIEERLCLEEILKSTEAENATCEDMFNDCIVFRAQERVDIGDAALQVEQHSVYVREAQAATRELQKRLAASREFISNLRPELQAAEEFDLAQVSRTGTMRNLSAQQQRRAGHAVYEHIELSAEVAALKLHRERGADELSQSEEWLSRNQEWRSELVQGTGPTHRMIMRLAMGEQGSRDMQIVCDKLNSQIAEVEEERMDSLAVQAQLQDEMLSETLAEEAARQGLEAAIAVNSALEAELQGLSTGSRETEEHIKAEMDKHFREEASKAEQMSSLEEVLQNLEMQNQTWDTNKMKMEEKLEASLLESEEMKERMDHYEQTLANGKRCHVS